MVTHIDVPFVAAVVSVIPYALVALACVVEAVTIQLISAAAAVVVDSTAVAYASFVAPGHQLMISGREVPSSA